MLTAQEARQLVERSSSKKEAEFIEKYIKSKDKILKDLEDDIIRVANVGKTQFSLNDAIFTIIGYENLSTNQDQYFVLGLLMGDLSSKGYTNTNFLLQW